MKKTMAVLLAALTLAAAAPAQVFAVADTKTPDTAASDKTSEAKALEAAILDVKSRVKIPEDLDKFNYETATEYGVTYYMLMWYKESDDGYERTEKSFTVTYYKGLIPSITTYDSERRDRRGFGKLTDTQAADYAKKYLYSIFPSIKGDPVIEREQSTDALTSSKIRYRITRPISGIPFDKNSGSITIDKDTGELLNYSLEWWNDATFPDASKRLSVERISEIYKERKPLKAQYQLFTRYHENEDGTYSYEQFTLPVYVPTVSGENEIDAITGKYTAIYEDKKTYSYTDAYNWTSYGEEYYEEEECAEEEPYYNTSNAALSAAEMAAVEDESKYLSYEKCLEIIKADEFIVFNKELVNDSNYLSTYTDIKGEEKPLRELSFRATSSDKTKDNIYLDVEMDAVTGEIIEFSKRYSYGSESPNKNQKSANDDKVLARANAAAKHFIDAKASEYKAGDKPYVGSSTLGVKSTSGTVHYTRYVNGLPTTFDNMSISVDSNDEVLSFSYNYHDIKFPEAKLVGEDAAYKKLFVNMKPDLKYTGFTDLQLKPHTYLTYYFDSNYTLNALTGERINTYDASPYYEAETPKAEDKVISYSDIKGYKYEKEIKTLLDYGVYATEDSKLAPESAITNYEFVTLFDSACDTSITRLYLRYDSNSRTYVKTEDADNRLTRGELARIYVYLYGNKYYSAAEVKGIYKAPYSDVKENDPYAGYITFAKYLDLTGAKDNFQPNKTFKKGDCIKMAYDYLAGDNDELDLYEIVKI